MFYHNQPEVKITTREVIDKSAYHFNPVSARAQLVLLTVACVVGAHVCRFIAIVGFPIPPLTFSFRSFHSVRQ